VKFYYQETYFFLFLHFFLQEFDGFRKWPLISNISLLNCSIDLKALTQEVGQHKNKLNAQTVDGVEKKKALRH